MCGSNDGRNRAADGTVGVASRPGMAGSPARWHSAGDRFNITPPGYTGMASESIVCESCGERGASGSCGEHGADEVSVREKDPPGQLIMMCDHQTVTYSLDEYDTEHLPPQSELPSDWVHAA